MIVTSLTRSDVRATVDAIARVQRPDGSIPWYERGQVDPWNHVEVAMALDVGGRHAEASRAYANSRSASPIDRPLRPAPR